ncbi:MAG: redoxin domain-containing protein [Candidatus Levybacteria bacterium]|nr:redoxin domain-containing protein [Candidatus Levybacteria bacterium]
MKGILLIIVGVIIVVLFGGIFLLRSNDSKEPSTSQKSTSSEISPNYLKYSEENLAKANERGRTILYFWAFWCPTCKALDAELRSRGNELPSDVTILQVNYDTERELKQKYEIVIQHTLVQIDQDGNEVAKWIGGGIETIKQQVK